MKRFRYRANRPLISLSPMSQPSAIAPVSNMYFNALFSRIKESYVLAGHFDTMLMHLSFSSHTPWILIKWYFFLFTSKCSSLGGDLILISVPSIDPITLGKPAISWNPPITWIIIAEWTSLYACEKASLNSDIVDHSRNTWPRCSVDICCHGLKATRCIKTQLYHHLKRRRQWAWPWYGSL